EKAATLHPIVVSEWRKGREEITKRGHMFIEGRPNAACPDHVFVTDHFTAFIMPDGERRAILSSMRYQERQPEIEEARKMLLKGEFHIASSDCRREGGDVRYDHSYGFWINGVNMRTAPGAGKLLSRLSGRPVLEIPTINEYYYHTDTFF